jgi:hypothetical protein
MALLAVQLIRIVLSTLNSSVLQSSAFVFAFNLSIYVNEMFNVIIRAVYFYFLY